MFWAKGRKRSFIALKHYFILLTLLRPSNKEEKSEVWYLMPGGRTGAIYWAVTSLNCRPDPQLQLGGSEVLRHFSTETHEHSVHPSSIRERLTLSVSALTRRTTAPIRAVVRSSCILVIGLVVRNGWGDCVICPII